MDSQQPTPFYVPKSRKKSTEKLESRSQSLLKWVSRALLLVLAILAIMLVLLWVRRDAMPEVKIQTQTDE